MKNILGNSNFRFKKWCVALIAVGWMGAAQAQVTIVGWDFANGSYPGGSGNFGASPAAANTIAANVTSTGLTRSGLGSTGTGAGSAWGGTATAAGSTGSASFTVKANDGYSLSLTEISAYNVRRSGTGPTTGQWAYSLDGSTFVNIGSAITWGSTTSSAGNAQTAIILSGISALQNLAASTTVTFKVTVTGSSSTGTWYLNNLATAGDDFAVKGTVSAGGGATAPTISGFSPSSGAVGTSVTINGSNFGASPVVKFNGTTAASSVNAGGTQITASVPAGATSGKITVELAGQTTATSAADFTVSTAGVATVSVTGGTLTAFSTVAGTVSTAQSFTVSGQSLTSDITVTAPAGFEVSTDALSYAPSKTLTQVSGTVAATTISVRIAASTAAGLLAAANVTVEATGVTTANVVVSGTVTQPALTLTLNPTSVAENAGANASTGTVGIPASLGTDLTVTLVSTNTAAATVPPSVTITNGQTNATFNIAAVASPSSFQPQTTSIQASNSNYTTASATLTVTNVDVPTAPLATKGWINEFHYDNTGTDSGEFVEIVLADTTPTTNVSVVLYNGGTPGSFVPYGTANDLASFTRGVSANGYTIYSKSFPVDGIQNGGTDGIALIIDNVVEEFISYEGSAVATSGAAAGYTSKDIGISESSSDAPGGSLYRYGPGSVGNDFAWAKAAVATLGQVNAGQTLGATGVQGTGTLTIANTTPSSAFVTQNIFPKATAAQTVSLTLTGTLSSGTISAMSVVVPAAFTGLTAGNVTVSGTGAGTPVTTLSGSTLTITGLIVDQLNPVTINIAGLTTPETAGDLTKDGNYPFTVQTGVDGNLQSLLIQPIAVVTIPIANLGDVDANGVSLDEGKTVAVQGVCTEENFNSTFSTSAYLQSGQPDGILKAGINIYSGLRNLFVRGEEYVVTGSVLNYSGLTELVVAASSQVVSLGTASAVPTPVTLTIAELTAAHEAYEGSLVRVVGLSKVSGTWALTVVGTVTSGSNITLANSGVNLTTRLNVGSTALTEPTYPAAINGIYGQFVAASPFTGGGQIQPRDQADIEDAPGLRLALGDTLINEGGSFTSTTLTISRTGGSVGSVSGVLSAGTLGKVQVLEEGVAQQLPYSFTLADGVASTTLTIEAIDNMVYGGDVNVVLSVTDSASSNPLSPGTATVTILENETAPAPDTTKPVITLIGANPLLIANGGTYADPGATVTDNVDANRTITGTGTVNTPVAGDYTITYNAADAAGNAAIAVTRTVTVAPPVVVESTYAVWSGGSTLDSAGLAKYAIGGASSLTANDGVKPTTALTGGFLLITAIVRTDNSSLTVVGQAVTDLASYASGTGVTTVNGVDTTDQTGVPTGHKRKTFSVAQGSDARKFIRLSASLSLSGTNTTVSVARDSGGATFLQVTGATAGATGGGSATSDKRTVYYFAPDTTSSPTYTGSAWPYVIVQGQLSAGVGVTATLTKNSSGMLLVNGLPAYQFVGDSSSTTANGVGGTWPGMKVDGTKTTTAPGGTLQ